MAWPFLMISLLGKGKPLPRVGTSYSTRSSRVIISLIDVPPVDECSSPYKVVLIAMQIEDEFHGTRIVVTHSSGSINCWLVDVLTNTCGDVCLSLQLISWYDALNRAVPARRNAHSSWTCLRTLYRWTANDVLLYQNIIILEGFHSLTFARF